MNLRRSIIGAVLAGASLVGVASTASSVAHAETPAATTDTEVGATAQSTRRFWIENLSRQTIYVADAWAFDVSAERAAGETPRDVPQHQRDPLLPDDSVPAKGTAIRPGEHITVEVVSQTTPHGVVVALQSLGGDRYADVVMYVPFNLRYSIGWSHFLSVEAGGQNITIR